MTPLFYMGIDPGFGSGAVAVISEDLKRTEIFDIDDNYPELCRFIEVWSSCRFAVVEKVTSSPRQGVASAFNFGRGLGWVESALSCFSIPFQEVRPQAWMPITGQKTIKENIIIGGDTKERNKIREQRKLEGKKQTFEFCRRVFPGAELKSFTKHHNRADALAIALYAWNECREVGVTKGECV